MRAPFAVEGNATVLPRTICCATVRRATAIAQACRAPGVRGATVDQQLVCRATARWFVRMC